ncbi:VOC family protein [Nonomuraea sp. NPDC059023]|uniref:VOC family protein n=1 Tax=unclassified Nonomuraea TaxID=2593643 RepID=UPI0036968902
MVTRAFPVVFARHVNATAQFYEWLGFQRHFQLPEQGEPGYVGLRRDSAEIAVVSAEWPHERYGAAISDGVRFEMFVYVSDVNTAVGELKQHGGTVLREPEDMPWGERVAYVADPDGNPVALAASNG